MGHLNYISEMAMKCQITVLVESGCVVISGDPRSDHWRLRPAKAYYDWSREGLICPLFIAMLVKGLAEASMWSHIHWS